MNPLHKDLNDIVMEAIHAVDPYQSIRAATSYEQGILRIRGGVFQSISHPRRPGDDTDFPFDTRRGNLYVVGAGKASSRMAMAVEEILGDTITEGIIVTKYGYTEPLRRVRQIEAGHPVPDRKGIQGAKEIEKLLKKTGGDDLVLVLISGGGSSLLPYPVKGISIQDKQRVTELLLSCGATIHEMNTIRKHLSFIKGGQLAKMAAPSHILTFILSDVIGDDLSVIASGPTAPDESTFQDALDILSFYDLLGKIPPHVLEHLRRGSKQEIEETPSGKDPIFKRVYFRFIGSNQIALEAASQKAEKLGYQSLILTNAACGEAREIAKFFSAIARQVATIGQPISPPACILSGGEPTVTLRGKGKGGRSQEFALAAGLEIDGLPDTLIASIGTDGTDGPTDAAGGYTDGKMLKKAREKQLNAHDFLTQNNAYPFLKQLGYLIKTGPTGTNVMDIQIILCKKI